MAEREEERRARNEALFREVNERISEVIAHMATAVPSERIEVLCECGSEDCIATLALTRTEYELVRSAPEQFVVIPGHEILHVEAVVAKTDRYEIVRKRGEDAAIARETDPRA
jgi:hypothetical protein